MVSGNPQGWHIAAEGKRYWEHGEGAAKIRWGTGGATRRCHRLLMAHARMTDQQAWGYCAERHHAVTGRWPGQKQGGKKREQLAPAQERGAVEIGSAMTSPTGAGQYDGGTLDLPDDWANLDLSQIPDLTGLTVDFLEQVEKDLGLAGGDPGGM